MAIKLRITRLSTELRQSGIDLLIASFFFAVGSVISAGFLYTRWRGPNSVYGLAIFYINLVTNWKPFIAGLMFLGLFLLFTRLLFRIDTVFLEGKPKGRWHPVALLGAIIITSILLFRWNYSFVAEGRFWEWNSPFIQIIRSLETLASIGAIIFVGRILWEQLRWKKSIIAILLIDAFGLTLLISLLLSDSISSSLRAVSLFVSAMINYIIISHGVIGYLKGVKENGVQNETPIIQSQVTSSLRRYIENRAAILTISGILCGVSFVLSRPVFFLEYVNQNVDSVRQGAELIVGFAGFIWAYGHWISIPILAIGMLFASHHSIPALISNQD